MCIWLCTSEVCVGVFIAPGGSFSCLFLFVSEYLWLFAAIPVNGLSGGIERALPQRVCIGSAICRRAVPAWPLRFCAAVTQNHTWQLCGHNRPGSLSFLPPPLPLALFSTRASFCRVLCGYEDEGLVYWDSARPALTSLGPDSCSPSFETGLLLRPATYMASPCNTHDLGLCLLRRFLGIPCYSFNISFFTLNPESQHFC